MAGPVLVADLAVVLRALVDVLDDEADGGAGRDLRAAGLVHHHAGDDADLVGLLPLGGEARLAGPALVEKALQVGLGQRHERRTAVDHAADERPMALTEGGEAEQVSERVVRHLKWPGAEVAAF